jgi:MscS family membrane protein
MSGFEDFLGTKVIGDATWRALMYLGGSVLGGLVASFVINAVLRGMAKAFGEGTWRHALLDAVYRPLRWALVVAGVWVGVIMLRQEIGLEDMDVESGWLITTELPFVLWFSLRLTENLTKIWLTRAQKSEGTYDDQLVPIVRTGVKVVLIAVASIMIIQNAGGDVGSLLAGFGIGGVAVAMASKDTIANLFGSLVIFIDRPFQIGDWVEIGGQEGTVEEVGLRVTRIRTFANSLITVPNSTLTTTPINNWSKMQKRRIKITLGLSYDTNADQMEQAVEAIREVLRTDERISQEFFLVNFTEFGPSSLDVFIYCFTKTTRWDEYLQVRQEVFLKFMRSMEKLGLSFAFPSQSVYLESVPKELRGARLG